MPKNRQCISFILLKYAHQKFNIWRICKTVKLLGLAFTFLLNSAFKCGPWQIAVFIPDMRSLNLRADCHRPELAASNPCYMRAGLGNPQCTWEPFANVVAYRDIGARSLASKWNSAPSVLHRESPNERRRIIVMCDFTSVKQKTQIFQSYIN
jgi:hypothetical protein